MKNYFSALKKKIWSYRWGFLFVIAATGLMELAASYVRGDPDEAKRLLIESSEIEKVFGKPHVVKLETWRYLQGTDGKPGYVEYRFFIAGSKQQGVVKVEREKPIGQQDKPKYPIVFANGLNLPLHTDATRQ